MTTSVVSICNQALGRLGGNTITSLSDGTLESKLCNTFYEPAVEYTLSEGAWACAVGRATLSRLTDTPAYGYSYYYQLPVSPRCLKVLEINQFDCNYYDSYAIEGDTLLTDLSTVSIKYIQLLTNPQSFDTYLTRAIVLRLAADIAFQVTGKESTVNMMESLYMEARDKGLSNSSSQGTAETIDYNEFTRVR